jgi:quinol monooxygenase YgiN
MATTDNCCTIAPYFKVRGGQMESFKKLCGRFVEKSRGESGCLFYGFSFNGDLVHCREGYVNAESMLLHIQSVGPIIDEALKISEMARLEIHGPEKELAKLRGPLAEFKPQFFVLEYGFRR